MGKKKHKKKQKKAEQADHAAAAAAAPSAVHRVGQALLDQARSPMGRQLIASGLVVAAAALAREATHATSGDTKPGPQDDLPRDPEAKTPGMSEVTALAGMAFSALDQFLRRKPADDKA